MGGPITVSAPSLSAKADPVVAGTPDGGFVVSWRAGTDIVFTTFNQWGSSTSAEIYATQVQQNSQFDPSLTVLTDGSFIVAWTDSHRDGSNAGVYGRRFSGATPLTNDFQIHTATAGGQHSARVTALANGGFAAVWERDNGIGLQRFDAMGVKVGGETIVGTQTGFEFDPSITRLANGDFAVAYSIIDGGVYATRIERFNAAGESVGAPAVMGGLVDPAIIGLADGGFAVSYATSNHVIVQRFTASGEKFGEEWSVTAVAAGNKQRPAMTLLNDGSFVVSWESFTGFEQANIRYARFRDGGTFLTDSADRAMFGNEADYIEGFGGDDELHGAGGGDVLDGGAGADIMVGGEGTDEVTYAGAGAAVSLNLAAGVHGGEAAGDSFVSIEQFSLSAFGDRFVGSAAGDRVAGMGGNDNLFGAGGDDELSGGTGDDILEGGDGADLLSGGEGWDEVRFTRDTEGVVLDFTTGSHGGSAAGDVYVGIEQFTLTGFNDYYLGTGGVDRVAGGNGHDTLSGGDGDDRIEGGEGMDQIYGGSGADTMLGGNGDDTYYVDSAADLVVESQSGGIDKIVTALGLVTDPNAFFELPANIENFSGASATGQRVRGNALDNTINVGAGNDFVDVSRGGIDTVETGDGRDVIYYGGAMTSADRNHGGAAGGDARGDLLILQGDYSAQLTLGGGGLVGIEKLRVLKGSHTGFGDTAGNSYDYNIATVEANVAAGGRLVVQGGSLQIGETLVFNGAAETDGSFQIFGGRDADILTGGARSDHLLGRAGSDTLIGSGGDDLLRGGLGKDRLEGGAGADHFVYAPQGGAEGYANAALESTSIGYDILVGFNYAEDRINLPGTVTGLSSDGTGALRAASFDADLAAALGSFAANSAILFTPDSGDLAARRFLVVDADGNGAYQANLDFVFELLDPVGTLPATPDFFI